MAVDPNIKKKADNIRNKIYGKEVRESLASGLEAMSSDVVESVGRQGNVESQFQDVIENTTDKDVISAPEIIAARNGEANLKTRIDKDHQEVTAQLAQTNEYLNPKNYSEGAVVTFIDDDAYSIFMERWKPLADSKNIKVNIAAITNQVGNEGSLSLTQLKQLESEGFEVVSHSHTHPNPTTATTTQWRENLELSRDWMITNDFTNTNTVVYPYGFSQVSSDKTILLKNATRDVFDYGLDFDTFGGLNDSALDRFQILRYNGAIINENVFKAKVDEAIEKNAWFIFTTHSHAYWDATVYGNLIDYIKSKNIPILTFSEAIEQFDTSVNIGDLNGDHFFVNKRGQVNFKGKVTQDDINKIPSWAMSTQPINYDMDIPATDYPKYSTTTVEVRTPSDTYFNEGGLLETYRGNTAFTYQKFRLYKSQTVYERKWDDFSETWGDFYEYSGVRTKNPTTYDMDKPISEYTQYMFTDIEIKPDSDIHFNTGGLMRVYSGTTGFSFALFYLYNSNTVYKRRWSGSAWLPFEKISEV